MGRTAKFKEDLLLEAVIKYSEVVKTRIKASELARWARNNIVGLENVKDYHFTRMVKNPDTGKLEKKLCTQRIEELNVARDTRQRENMNVLLSSVNMDRFFEMDARSQRKAIQETREIVSEYKRANVYLRKQNDYLKSLIAEMNEKTKLYAAEIKDIKRKQTLLDKKVADVRRNINNERLRNQLEGIGIIDGDFDLVKYNESLREGIEKIFNIEEAIKLYQRNLNVDENTDDEPPQNTLKKDSLIDDLLDF